MRVAATAPIGAAAVGSLMAVSVIWSGCLAAASLLLAYFAGVTALGLVVAAMVDTREERTLRGGPVRHFTGHWHECGKPLIQTGPVWICPTCDRVPQHFVIGRRRRTR